MSSRSELVRLFGGRPPFVIRDGWTVSISTHDEWHLRVRRLYRRRVLDASGSVASVERYARFLAVERRWYREHGLMPPGWTQQDDDILARTPPAPVASAVPRGGRRERKRAKVTPAVRATIRAKAAKGLSLDWIAQQVGLHRKTVREYV